MHPIDLENKSLRELGYRMPAEWEPHRATWLAWPTRESSWPGKFAPVPAVWARMARELCEAEEVHILVDNQEAEAAVRRFLKEHKADASNVFLHEFPTNDAWIRDFGPIFVVGDSDDTPVIAVNWEYNAWGGKYPPWDDDNKIPQRVADFRKVPVVSGGMVLEGGSIDVNGRGLLLTTEACLLNPNRNPNLTREQIEQRMKDFLGIEKVLWLNEGIVGDDTDGHIDDLTRFVSEHTLVTIIEKDEKDENYPMLRENMEILKDLRGIKGEKFEIIELPMPDPVVHEETRLPASYANFYIGNGVVLVPTYDTPRADSQAVGIIQDLFPGRRAIGVRATDMVWGLGAFHCATQQEPQRP